jgi:hypothetical protein
MATPPRRHLCAPLLLSLATLLLPACYTAQDLERLAAQKPDPRQEQIERLWRAMGALVAEEQWPLTLERRQDLIMVTQWQELEDDLRRQIRLLVLVAPVGIGINVHVTYQRRDERTDLPPDEAWAEVHDPVLQLRQRGEERAFATRIQQKWAEGP